MNGKSSENNAVLFKHVKYQYLAVYCVNIINFCHGSGIGWMSPAIPVLKGNDTPLTSGPITVEQISWIGACFSIGALLGNLIFSILLRYIGLRRTMILLTFPNMLFWLLVILAQSPEHLYIGRMLTGLTGGGIYICVPVFVSEIADPRVRGSLGSMLMMILCSGILASFVAGTYLPYAIYPYIFIGLPIVYLIALLFFPETPQNLINRGQMERAERAFIFYRLGNDTSPEHSKMVSDELQALQTYLKIREEEQLSTKLWSVVSSRNSIKGIMTGIGLTFLNLFSGTLAMISYTTMVFKESGSTVDPNTSSIIVAAVQVISVYISSMLVDRLGRKTLLMVSSGGAAIACVALGTFSYLHQQNVDLSAYNWVPLLFFSFYVVITCMGILPLPFIILAEILPADIRQVGSAICMISISVFAFITLKAFPVVTAAFGLHTTLWICGGVCVLGLLFAIFILSETKGKNLHAVENQ